MGIQQDLEGLSQALEEAHIRHALIGGLALAVFKVVRFTNDIDLLVHGAQRGDLLPLLYKLGFQPYQETKELIQLSGSTNVDITFAHRAPSQAMLKRAVKVEPLKIPCVTIEDLMGLKIQAFQNDRKREFQDKADIQALATNNTAIDWNIVKAYAEVFGCWKEIEAIRERVSHA